MRVTRQIGTHLQRFFDSNLLPTTVIAATIFQFLVVARKFFESNPPPVGRLPIVYQYGGWYMTQGAVLYVDIAALRPPLGFQTTAIISYLVGGNMYLLHLVSLLFSNAAVVGTVALTTVLVYEHTEHTLSSLLAGLTVLAFPNFYIAPSLGLRVMAVAVCLGLLGVYLALQGKPFLAGVASAAGAGYWQLSIIFPVLVVGLIAQRRDRRIIFYTLTGMAATTMLVLLPSVLSGSIDELLRYVLVYPVTKPELANLAQNRPLLQRPISIVKILGYSTPLILVALYGAYQTGIARSQWWVPVGGAWSLFQVFFVSFENWTDLQILWVFVALGTGMAVYHLTSRSVIRNVLTAVVVLAFLFGPYWMAGPSLLPAAVADSQLTPPTSSDIGSSIAEDKTSGKNSMIEHKRDVYWQQKYPESCRDKDYIFLTRLGVPDCHNLPRPS